jgi:hypothetical protein
VLIEKGAQANWYLQNNAAISHFIVINEDFCRWARPHKDLWRGVLGVRRSLKSAENPAIGGTSGKKTIYC